MRQEESKEKVILGYTLRLMPARDIWDHVLGVRKTGTVTHCTNGDSPVVTRDRARPSAWRFSCPYLPAKVSEADVKLMFLAGLPLVSAAVFCTDKEAKEENQGRERNTHVQVWFCSGRAAIGFRS